MPPPPSKCACSNNAGSGHTYHEPAGVDPNAATPCFEAHPFYHPTTREHYNNPCFFQTGSLNFGQVDRCLTPPARTSPATKRAVFLVGDSHAGALYPAVERAVAGKLSLVMAARRQTQFARPGKGDKEGDEANQEHFKNDILRSLRSRMEPGDVLLIMNVEGGQSWGHQKYVTSGYTWLLDDVLEKTVRAHNASLILAGDNPQLNRAPTMCQSNHALCHVDTHEQRIREDRDTALIELSEGRPDVFAFIQTHLWQVAPGSPAFHGNVPGTTTNAYYDHNHLLSPGTNYLGPYLCDAFNEWGFFD